MFIVRFAMLCVFTHGIFLAAMLGTSCLVQFCGPCMKVMDFEYTVFDLNYTNIISIIKAEISNPLLAIPHPNSNTLITRISFALEIILYIFQ